SEGRPMFDLKIGVLLALSWAAFPVLATADATKGEPAKKEYAKTAPIARMVFYTGRVQGVGFRATTAEMARAYPVTGWVKNLPDGRVQLVVEGPAEAVQDFLKAIRTHWNKNVKKEVSEERAARGKFKTFAVAD